jgi:hypothetical protein
MVSILDGISQVLQISIYIDKESILYRFLPRTSLFFFPYFSLLVRRFYSSHILKMSSLLEPDSSFAASGSVESSTTTQSQSTKWRSNVWEHCRRPTKDENAAFLYCSHCLFDSRKSPYGTAIA